MATADPTGRPAAAFPCIYWGGNSCTADKRFAEDSISCFNDGLCDGFGTCRGCTRYDQGGLKYGDVDGQGGTSQQPFNLQLYNIRAQLQQCCNWNGEPGTFRKDFATPDDVVSAAIQSITRPDDAATNEDANGYLVLTAESAGFPDGFPAYPSELIATRDGTDEDGKPYPRVNIRYNAREENVFYGVRAYPANSLNDNYTISLAVRKAKPIYRPVGTTNLGSTEEITKCVVADAAPWQEGFTDENPAAYGCNGAKPECPYYTGPKFTEVVDEKMDTGYRITAKQVLELRFYSNDWSSLVNPREVWEQTFTEPDIWAWYRSVIVEEGEDEPPQASGGVKDDTTGKPLIQKVTINQFDSESPQFSVGAPVVPSTGTPVQFQPPNWPTFIKELNSLSSGLKVLFPRGTAISDPFVKKIFTHDDRFFYISALLGTENEVVAVNLTKHSQGNLPDEYFLEQTKLNNPEDVYYPQTTGMPGSTFKVELTTEGFTRAVNHIRIFLDTGVGDEDEAAPGAVAGTSEPTGDDNDIPSLPNGDRVYQKFDIYVELQFYHIHIAQDTFNDYYGHQQIDPWVNHITRFDLGGDILDLTGNTTVDDILWVATTSEAKQTIYSIEEQIETTSEDASEIEWESLGCGHILVKFLNPKVNRVFSWKASGEDSNEEALYVKVDRTANDNLAEGSDTEIEMELAFSTTDGSILPANYAIFRTPTGEAITPFDTAKDILQVRYAYTEYKQGPIADEDIPKLTDSALVDKVTDLFPYEIGRNGSRFTVEGTFIKAGEEKLYSCEDVIGDCYTDRASDNETLAREVFFDGGVGEESVETVLDMTLACREQFDIDFTGTTFSDGTAVTYEEAKDRVKNLYLKEGSLHFMFIAKDEDGRPIGYKYPAFLAQSAIAQARDVEIRYKWGAQMQHYPVHDLLVLFASFYQPTYSVTWRLLRLVQEYDPFCGDHNETVGGQTGFAPFNLDEDDHGALWYPYVWCQTPAYHGDSSVFTNPRRYDGTVEGFFGPPKRRYYWERMRCFDKYMPAIIDYIPQQGCFWSERTTTVNANPPFVFFGYTKIRSSHAFGHWATDRESIRVSRHWKKRNLEIDNETLSLESDKSYSITPTEEFEAAILGTGGDTATPIWMHINDGISVVSPMTESLEEPFAHLLLDRTGVHDFNETHFTERYDLRDILEEKDFTTTLDRSEDGTQVYAPDETVFTTESGTSFIFDEGNDIRLVFKAPGEEDGDQAVWAWLTEPDDIERGSSTRIDGIQLKNPDRFYFKKNLLPAVHTTEDAHELAYTPYVFDDNGNIETRATLSLDGGPPLEIDPDDFLVEDNIFTITSSSPYNPLQHAGEDYSFRIFNQDEKNSEGNYERVATFLADGRGLQRFENPSGGDKLATYAGILVSNTINVDELPYETVDLSVVDRDFLDEDAEILSSEISKYKDLIREYGPGETLRVKSGLVDFKGHYYVESVEIQAFYGIRHDLPSIAIEGTLYSTGKVTTLINPTTYISGLNVSGGGTTTTVTLAINQRLKNINIYFGARAPGRRMQIDSIRINVREPKARTETITTQAPKVTVSYGNTGTHKPSDLELYFQRSYPDFATNYDSGGSASTSIKFLGRRIKDVIPTFDFTDPISNRFPYANIDVTTIPGYATESAHAGEVRYIAGSVQACSKGWAMYTNDHSSDPGGSLSDPNSFNGVRPFEDLQEELYSEAGSLLGDKTSVYNSFWHPKEIELFDQYGVNLEGYNWTLILSSTVAPINRVMRHEGYGCEAGPTSEEYDGTVHKLENWQGRGVFHYACDAVFNWSCLTTVMNKCYNFLYQEYGTESYLDNNVVSRFTYRFTFPPREYQSYVAAGLVDKNYIGGRFGGYDSASALGTASFGALPLAGFGSPYFNPISLPPKGPGSY